MTKLLVAIAASPLIKASLISQEHTEKWNADNVPFKQ